MEGTVCSAFFSLLFRNNYYNLDRVRIADTFFLCGCVLEDGSISAIEKDSRENADVEPLSQLLTGGFWSSNMYIERVVYYTNH